MEKKNYDVVFVVLVYRNTKDLKEFFLYNKVKNSRTIVVNSYYDEESKKNFQIIAEENGADFFSIPNNGYSYGNNYGCEYAFKTYNFDYIIISNPDIQIQNFDTKKLQPYGNCIIAPYIKALKRKTQNPNLPFDDPVFRWIKYKLLKGRHRKMCVLSGIISRLERELYLKIIYPLFRKKHIYSAHGSFVIIPNGVYKALRPLYNEKMFLFAEEEHLAQLAKHNRISTIYLPEIVVLHKEKSSTSLLGNNFEYLRSSYMEYYDYWYKK